MHIFTQTFVGVLLTFKFSKKTYLIVIKVETGLKFKINDSTLFLIGSIILKNREMTQCLQKTET